MKTVHKQLGVTTQNRNQMLDITDQVNSAVVDSGIKDGFCIVFCPHTTAGITINEHADPSVTEDMLMTFSQLIPKDNRYRHAEGNSDSHCKSTLVGASEHIIIKDSRLLLGTWQGVYFCEFDGPRSRKVNLFVYGQ
ncbi:MAG: secondary thiamine-phosphate synthase enzyme YjbQ [Phycisphaerae bacterium]|nr:secondary thiamine-phosphate synthase enzyme YjbQ [Phycisphaerae bacterium]